jgi:hypothetical protein
MTSVQSGPAFSLQEGRLVLRQTPAVLTALLAGLPPRMLEVDEGPGTWSCLAVLRHLVWCEEDNWVQRVRIIRERGGEEAFRSFDREEGFRRYAGWPVERLLTEFSSLRARRLAEIEAMSLDAKDLATEGRHPTFGRVTLEQLLATWVTHDFAHLTQMSRVLTRDAGRHIGPWRAFFSLLRESPPGS